MVLLIGSTKFQIYLHCKKGKDELSMLVAAKTSGATPLVIACRNGHYDVAEYLIDRCQADIEQPGSGNYISNISLPLLLN